MVLIYALVKYYFLLCVYYCVYNEERKRSTIGVDTADIWQRYINRCGMYPIPPHPVTLPGSHPSLSAALRLKFYP